MRDVLDVHVLDADRPAVGFAQGRDQLAERRPADRPRNGMASNVRSRSASVQAELAQFEIRMRRRRVGERIDLGDQVAEIAIGVDQAEDAELGRGVGRRGRGPLGEGEAFEERPPQVIDGRRVGLPALVGVVNRTLVPTGRKRCVHGENRLGDGRSVLSLSQPAGA